MTCTNTNMQVGKPPQKPAVEVELELQRSRAQARRGDLIVNLQTDVGLNEVFGKHVALGEEVVVSLKGCQGCLQRGRCLRDVLGLFLSLIHI